MWDRPPANTALGLYRVLSQPIRPPARTKVKPVSLRLPKPQRAVELKRRPRARGLAQNPAIPTTGLVRWDSTSEPRNGAWPKAKTPPSEATSRVVPPAPWGTGAMPTTGCTRWTAPVKP